MQTIEEREAAQTAEIERDRTDQVGELMQLVEARQIDTDRIDDLVLDCAIANAAVINEAGLKCQLEFLVISVGLKNAEQLFQERVGETKEMDLRVVSD